MDSTLGVTSQPQQQVAIIAPLNDPSVIDQDEFQALMEQIRTELTTSDCQTELLDAARYNDVNVVRALLLCHPTLHEYQDPVTGNTALHMSAANGHVDVVQLLLYAGANVTCANHAGNTPLHWAASNGQEQTVALLLRPPPRQQQLSAETSSIDVLQRNMFGRSILTEGFSSDNAGVIHSLLEHESASEERLLQTTPSRTTTTNPVQSCSSEHKEEQQHADEDAEDAATHDFIFGIVSPHLVSSNGQQPLIKLRVRELPIARTDQDSIFGQGRDDADATGLGIWPASLVCAQWVASGAALLPMQQQKRRNSNETTNWWEGKTVLELGAGCGIPGLVAANAGAGHVILTDLNARTVNNQRHNIALNQAQDNVMAMLMDWNNPDTWPRDKVDVIIGSDLVYQSEMVPVLLGAIHGLLKDTGILLYVCPDTGRDGHKDLLSGLLQRDFELLSEVVAPPEYVRNPLENCDDEECFLHFHELFSSKFILYSFLRKRDS